MHEPAAAQAPTWEGCLASLDERLASGERRLRVELPGAGRLLVDRPLPYLCLYRRPRNVEDAGTERLVMAEAAFLVAPAGRSHRAGVYRLLERIVAEGRRRFGDFLVLEVVAAPASTASAEETPVPRFRVLAAPGHELSPLLEPFVRALESIRAGGALAEVEVAEPRAGSGPRAAQGPGSVVGLARRLGCKALALLVDPIYRNSSSGALYPLLARRVQRELGRATARLFFAFLEGLDRAPRSPLALGRRGLPAAVFRADAALAELGQSFSLLLAVTPVNLERAHAEFRRNGGERAPELRYRPLPRDPCVLKRRLFALPIERIQDPTLAALLRGAQLDLDRKLTLLLDRGTRRFLASSLALFGAPSEALGDIARGLLASRAGARRRTPSWLGAKEIVERARGEVERYRASAPDFDCAVELREDLYQTVIFSRGRLLVGRRARVEAVRVEALLHHELGTHALTWFNGRAQPLQLLRAGLPNYTPLQEGLAVLAELLGGTLAPSRLRRLAARVLAVDSLVRGAEFVETYRLLVGEHGLAARDAFDVTARVFRGGGLTKDYVYLAGLVQLMGWIAEGGVLEGLLVGKLALEHQPVVDELLQRRVLRPPRLLPSYLGTARARAALEWLRSAPYPCQLLEPPALPAPPARTPVAAASGDGRSQKEER